MNKNKLMIGLAGITFGLTILVQIAHRANVLGGHGHDARIAEATDLVLPGYFNLVNGLFLALPFLLLAVSVFLLYKKPNARYLPLIVTLTLTFSIISMIMGGFGAVEYHFGIFMVLATMAYYNSIPLVSLMAGLFAFQHLLGYFFAPATLFVYGPGDYSFLMVMIHAVFVVLTSGAVAMQIASNKKQVKDLEAINQASEQTIQSIIEQLVGTSDQVDLTARKLTTNASSTQSSSEEVKHSIQKIREGSKKQVSQALNSQKILDSFSRSIDEIETNSRNIVSSSKLMTTESTEGFQLVEQTTEEMGRLSEAFNHVKQMVSSLDSRSKEIDSIITVISAISEKTNLLALNAAIEAAQAGAAGKGFAVVAEEVRKLSNQTDEAVKKVGSIIKTIQSDSNQANESVSIGQSKMADSLNSVAKTETKFQSILEAVQTLDNDINKTASTSASISTNSQKILEALDLMQEIAEETAIITDTTDDQSVKQLQLIKDTTEIAQSLSVEVEKLNPLIQKLQGSTSEENEELIEDLIKPKRFGFKKKAAVTPV
ncbi:MAG: hypothetical protein JJU16_10040 [Alkalibacterium sp.]|nr:hypothetical protein [Alkalibacterium sp.]